MRNIAVILAGGSGTRMGLDLPKQFLQLDGKTILEHSVDAFLQNSLIEAVIIVSNPGFVTDVEAIVALHHEAAEWSKVMTVIPGGKERSDSSVNALRYVQEQLTKSTLSDSEATAVDEDTPADYINIIFHDAVRPLVDQRIITDVCEALLTHTAVNVTLPVVDTIIQATHGVMLSTVDRSSLQRVQTPQGFRLTTIAEAYRLALADPAFRATDDCGVVLHYLPDTPIALVRGSEHNLKLTFRDDIPLFEFLLKQRIS